ncbi:hypothetical protein NBRC116583_24490 [Arenicella sp. 4NH20-0111]|uniref:hypothetical protein n=1 Tax=Arenicella sp. 4NH20-0111 TaxID=3127648 RepID=UPI0031096056
MSFAKLVTICSILAATVYPHQSFGDSPSFTYVGTQYIANGDFSVGDGNLSADLGLDGFALDASLELGIFFIQASRYELESDQLLGGSIEDNISTVAAGMTFELPQSQLYGLVRARRDELKGRLGNLTEELDGTTVGVEAGLRINITNRFELNANVGVPSIDEGTSYGAGAQFFITNNLGLTFDIRSIELEEGDVEAKFDTTSIGLRFSF